MIERYSLLERWLHWLALEPAAVRALSFELECMFALPRKSNGITYQQADDRPVYVCGLARSGTTMLLNLLEELNCFRSLTYRDMPFVLAPNLWRMLSGFAQRRTELAERAHGDGVMVGYDSPESFEEVFWRTFSSTADCSDAGYGSGDVSSDALKMFTNYRTVVTNPRSHHVHSTMSPRRYLSKNNNNLLRLSALASNPLATVLLVYRDPIDTAQSLYLLHKKFCENAQHDTFTKKYMGWLGHHEFGLGHMPFSFAKKYMDIKLTPNNPDYWLDYWCAVYEFVLQQNNVRFFLVNYDTMQRAPVNMLGAIFSLLKIHGSANMSANGVRPPKSTRKDIISYDPELRRKAEMLYSELSKDSKNVFQSL